MIFAYRLNLYAYFKVSSKFGSWGHEPRRKGTGNPIVHFGFSGASGYSDLNTAASNYTASNHIDIVNDDFGTDKPGSGNYCGPQASTNNLPCRMNWPSMATGCYAASTYQANWVALPVSIVDISATNSNGSNIISCNVEVPGRISKMILERSEDGTNFKSLQTIMISQVSKLNNYQITDTKPLIGKNFYRIAIIDDQGKTIYSKITEVKTAFANTGTIKMIYPNPFTDNITFVFFSTNDQNTTFEIYDIRGKKLISQSLQIHEGENKFTFPDLSGLTKGVYFVKMKSKNEPDVNYKIIKLQ